MTVPRLAILLAAALATSACDTSLELEVARAIRIAITPADTAVLTGAEVRYAATIEDQQGRPLQRAPTWHVDDTTRASITVDGTLRALAHGTVNIIARVDTFSESARLTIRQPSPKGVPFGITPVRGIVSVGDTLRYTIVAAPSDLPIVWSVRDTSIAIIDGNGLVTGRMAGETTVTAISSSNPTRRATVLLTVR